MQWKCKTLQNIISNNPLDTELSFWGEKRADSKQLSERDWKEASRNLEQQLSEEEGMDVQGDYDFLFKVPVPVPD